MNLKAFENEILNCTRDKFNDLALKIFRFQSQNCTIYRDWMKLSGIDIASIEEFSQIPYMPVSLFKGHEVRSVTRNPDELVFSSSSTTGSGQSFHHVPYAEFYTEIFTKTFENFYGFISNYRLIALLPSYLDRPGSSLIYMVNYLIQNAQKGSCFINKNTDSLISLLQQKQDTPTVLFGVTYALIDLCEKVQPLNTIIMETGGMKGHRKEMTKPEVHEILSKGFGVGAIHSEYGMTELMSQAYSKGQGLYECPPWMQVRVFEPTDPMTASRDLKVGRLCISDLANLYSCCFIATDDLGKRHSNGSFELGGRLDFSDIRGCNLLWG